MRRDVVVRGGRLVDPTAGVDAERDVLLRDGRVAAVERPGALAGVERAEVVEAGGCVVAPGLIDVHVHLREPGQTWKETIATGTRAAARGGFTTVVAMPNTVPVTDTAERLRWVTAPERGAVVRVLAMAAATVGSLGGELTDYEGLAAAGAVGFTDDGRPVLAKLLMRDALLRAGRLGVVVSQHAEDLRRSNSSGVNAGRMGFRLGLRGMSRDAEWGLVERDIALLREIEREEGLRARLHVQHVSTREAVALVRRARVEGLAVTSEATPHHFALTEERVGEYDTDAKMNPPLRAEEDRLAVVEGLVDGTVGMIATDHAPHARHEKEVEFERAPNGITGLETALGVALRELGPRMGVTGVVERMSAGPARLIGRGGLGTLRVGSAADAVVFAPEERWVYRAAEGASRSRNTPFEGEEMMGRVRATIFGGAVVFRG